jgi:hypothetical protein
MSTISEGKVKETMSVEKHLMNHKHVKTNENFTFLS